METVGYAVSVIVLIIDGLSEIITKQQFKDSPPKTLHAWAQRFLAHVHNIELVK